MKKFLALLVLLLVSFTFVAAQGNGNGNGNNGNGNGCGNNGNGNSNSNSAWSCYWPNWVITWLENGGNVPMPLAVAVIREARSWGQQNFGLNQGQMIVKYLQGQLTVDYVPTAPPSLIFRVSYAGGDLIVVLVDL
jgi:hypothetical protein